MARVWSQGVVLGRGTRRRCSLVFVGGTFIREGYFEWLETRIELQLTQTCDLSRTGGWDFLATRCLGWVKIDWRRRDSPEGGRDDMICGMRFEGAYGLPLMRSRSRVGWVRGGGLYVLVVVVDCPHWWLEEGVLLWFLCGYLGGSRWT